MAKKVNVRGSRKKIRKEKSKGERSGPIMGHGDPRETWQRSGPGQAYCSLFCAWPVPHFLRGKRAPQQDGHTLRRRHGRLRRGTVRSPRPVPSSIVRPSIPSNSFSLHISPAVASAPSSGGCASTASSAATRCALTPASPMDSTCALWRRSERATW
jgi:hypothetical protein